MQHSILICGNVQRIGLALLKSVCYPHRRASEPLQHVEPLGPSMFSRPIPRFQLEPYIKQFASANKLGPDLPAATTLQEVCSLAYGLQVATR